MKIAPKHVVTMVWGVRGMTKQTVLGCFAQVRNRLLKYLLGIQGLNHMAHIKESHFVTYMLMACHYPGEKCI
jgi:hypothetical protein